MTFISYAQNYEDVMLWRALHSVEAGFWIDVGAAHPTEFSVTRAFYDRSWHGVNIEPEPDYAALLRAERPRDINLQMVVADTPGRTIFYRIPGTGLSTIDATIAADQASAGFPTAERIDVEATTLAAICAAHAPRDIHFLKIDVEGAERAVLRGADFTRYRPWIILAEATVPGSPVPRIESFADLLIAAGYRQCWFDGLNAYFLAQEHEARLAPCFQTPPNVFDDFMRADHAAAERRVVERDGMLREAGRLLRETKQTLSERDYALHEAEAALSTASAEHQAAMRASEMEIQQRDAETDRLRAELGAMHDSTSWRLTAPLRAVKRHIKA